MLQKVNYFPHQARVRQGFGKNEGSEQDLCESLVLLELVGVWVFRE